LEKKLRKKSCWSKDNSK